MQDRIAIPPGAATDKRTLAGGKRHGVAHRRVGVSGKIASSLCYFWLIATVPVSSSDLRFDRIFGQPPETASMNLEFSTSIV